MKLRRLHNAKRSSLTFLLLLMMLVAALKVILPVHAQTTIAVVPPSNVANPNEWFLVNVTITDVIDLYSYGIRIGFDGNVLMNGTPAAVEGPFLKEGTASPFPPLFTFVPKSNYIYVACTSIGPQYGGVDGDGTLFTLNFTVEAAGTSTLHLYDTVLINSPGADISHSTSDGDFYTRVPVASFSFTPDTYGRPIVGENVTFDASDSYDPDNPLGERGILNYIWDFGDGTSGTGMMVTHAYNESSPYPPWTPYNVTLTVTDDDDEGLNSTNTFFIKTKKDGVNVKFHDISIVDITTPEEIHTKQIATIDVTVLNNGSHPDTFNVTAYYDSKPIETETKVDLPPGENKTFTFDWYTYIASQTSSSNDTQEDKWINPLNAYASDDLYTSCGINNTYQQYRDYKFYPTGWTDVSKVEVGIEAYTDTGGDDQLGISVSTTGTVWSEEYVSDITSTTDETFWVDVTGTFSWSTWQLNNTKVRMRYLQVGDINTTIYVDWLQLRISPLNPIDIPEGTYAIWASALLVEPIGPPVGTHDFRPSEEEDMTDNMLFGDPIVVTQIPYRDVNVTKVEVSPGVVQGDITITNVAFGATATVKVEVKNEGNMDETFYVLVEEREPGAASSTEVGRETVLNLRAGATKKLRFALDRTTNSTVEGEYNITAYIRLAVADPPENVSENNVQTLKVLMRLLPVSSFTFSPEDPTMGDEVTFDASASYAPGDPGGDITDYIWDFGDETDATGVAIVTNIYNNPGTYTVKLTVVDDQDLNSTETRSVKVQKLNSTITISASPMTVPISLNTTISGSISAAGAEPVRANVNVFINYMRIDEVDWISLANVSTNENSEYSFVWVPPQQNGTYTFKASWPGDVNTKDAVSPELNVTVTIQDVAIVDVVLSKIRLTTGENLTIDVTAANKGTATETFNVTIYHNDTLLETKTLTNLTAGVSETLSFNWDTQGIEEGVYIVKAVAEPLLGETLVTDNSRTSGVVIQELPTETPVNIFLYTTVGLAIGIAVMAAYLLRMIKSKPK